MHTQKRIHGLFTALTLTLVLAGVPQTAASEEKSNTVAEPATKDSKNLRVTAKDNEVIIETGSGATAQSETLQLDTNVLEARLHGEQLYVALGSAGMRQYRIQPDLKTTLEKDVRPQGSVTGFFSVNGKLWMQLESVSGIPVAGGQSVSMAEPGVRQPTTAPKKDNNDSGSAAIPAVFSKTNPVKIIKEGKGEVLLNVGAKDGVTVTTRFSVFRQQKLNRKGLGNFQGMEQVAVLTVTAVNEDNCLAKLPRSDRVYKTDVIMPYTDEHKPRIPFPRRLDRITELAFVIRPVLNVATDKGAGALTDIDVTHFGKSWFVNFKVGPSAIGWNEKDNILSMSLLAQGGYDGRAFAVGLGAGLALVNGNMDRMLDKWDDENANEDPRGSFALSQFVRLGARDGLNLTVQNTFFYYNDKAANNDDEDDSGFVYGGSNGKISIPLNDRMDLFLNGGGGRFGYGFGEIGIFAWLTGNGDAGSIGISAAAGGAGMWAYKRVVNDEYTDFERIRIGGPMVSLGFAWRFGPPHDITAE